jgi:hypothetical protein
MAHPGTPAGIRTRRRWITAGAVGAAGVAALVVPASAGHAAPVPRTPTTADAGAVHAVAAAPVAASDAAGDGLPASPLSAGLPVLGVVLTAAGYRTMRRPARR